MILVLLLKARSPCSENLSNFIKISLKEGILLSCQAEKWLHLSDFCCVCKAREWEWKVGFSPHFSDALVFTAGLYRMMGAAAHWCCSVVLLQFTPAENLIYEEFSSCFLVKVVLKVFCKAVLLTSVSPVYVHLFFSMWHPRDPCQKKILCSSWHIVSRKNNEKYFPVPVYVHTVPSTSPLRFGCYIKEE